MNYTIETNKPNLTSSNLILHWVSLTVSLLWNMVRSSESQNKGRLKRI